MKIEFHKLSANGNDFVVIDNRGSLLEESRLSDFAQHVCASHTGVGADGLLLLVPSVTAHYRMRYLNSDGSEAEMCGNGARALGWYAREQSLWDDRGTFQAGNHIHRVIWQQGSVGISLRSDGAPEQVTMEDGTTGWSVDTGVPHLVILSDNIGHLDVEQLGRRYRYDKAFAETGTNVDFMMVEGDALRVRTYERGVERETLACGTGALACALIGMEVH